MFNSYSIFNEPFNVIQGLNTTGYEVSSLENDGAVFLIIMNNNDNDNNAPLFGQLVVMEENICQFSDHSSEASQLLSSMLFSESSYSSV